MKIRFVLLFLILSTAYPQISSCKIDKLVNEAMDTFNVTGVAIGIVKDGKVVHSKGYGVKSIDTNEPIDVQTNFAIASNTKAFTTAALAILEDKGKIGWNDKVIDYIPEFRMYNDYVTHNFIIEDLVTHRSGLGLGAGDLQFWPTGSDFAIDDIINNFQYLEPTSDFRTKYDYDNMLYIVAGEVIKRVTGISWEEFVRKNIFEPINMENSYCNYSELDDYTNMAEPHFEMDGKYTIVEPFQHDPDQVNGAAASIISNVNDMTKWLQLQLDNGKYGNDLGNELFSEENHREMWKLHTIFNADTSSRYNSHFAGYGLGWNLTDVNGKMLVTHVGYVSGMLSRVALIPDLNFGMVILTNTEFGGGRLTRVITNTIVDRYLGLKDKDWLEYYVERFNSYDAKGDSVVSNVWETVDNTDQTAINFDDYIGIYQDDWFGKVQIDTVDNQLWFTSFRSPKLTGPMYYYKANAFAIKWEIRELAADAFTIFSLDEEGKAQSISMKGISPNIDFSYDFQDLDLKRVD